MGITFKAISLRNDCFIKENAQKFLLLGTVKKVGLM